MSGRRRGERKRDTEKECVLDAKRKKKRMHFVRLSTQLQKFQFHGTVFKVSSILFSSTRYSISFCLVWFVKNVNACNNKKQKSRLCFLSFFFVNRNSIWVGTLRNWMYVFDEYFPPFLPFFPCRSHFWLFLGTRTHTILMGFVIILSSSVTEV